MTTTIIAPVSPASSVFLCPKCKAPLSKTSEPDVPYFCFPCQAPVSLSAAKIASRVKSAACSQPGTAQISLMLFFPLPPNACSPNKKAACWEAEAAARALYKSECLLAIERQLGSDTVSIQRACTLDMRLYLGKAEGKPRYYPRDRANAIAATKALVDAIVEAGVLADDSKEYLYWGDVDLWSTQAQHKGRSMVAVILTTR